MNWQGFYDRINDALLGIRTTGYRTVSDLQLPDSSIGYSPVPYGILRRMLRSVPRALRQGRFVDYGSGLGRVLACAARNGFSGCIGVELSEELAAASRRQLSRYPQCEVCCVDARAFQVPPDAAVFFFYNPFSGDALEAAIQNIAESIQAHPRNHRILAYYNLAKMEAAARAVGTTLERIGFEEKSPGFSWGSYIVAHGGTGASGR